MIHSREVNDLNLLTLKERIPEAFNAISTKKYRQALVLTGIFDVASWKGPKEDYEIEYSQESESLKIGPFFRFGQVFVGQTVWRQTKPENWKFDPNTVSDMKRFDGLNDIQRFIESLYLLVAGCEEGKSAWQKIIDKDNSVFDWSTNLLYGFSYISKNILEKDLRNNERRIRALIY